MNEVNEPVGKFFRLNSMSRRYIHFSQILVMKFYNRLSIRNVFYKLLSVLKLYLILIRFKCAKIAIDAEVQKSYVVYFTKKCFQQLQVGSQQMFLQQGNQMPNRGGFNQAQNVLQGPLAYLEKTTSNIGIIPASFQSFKNESFLSSFPLIDLVGMGDGRR